MLCLQPNSTSPQFIARAARGASSTLPLLALLLCSACASSGGNVGSSDDPVLVPAPEAAAEAPDLHVSSGEAAEESEPEVPAAVAESEHSEAPPTPGDLPEVVVTGRERHIVIRDL